MRILSGIASFLVLGLLLGFAVENSAKVTLHFWPTGELASTPLYLVAFAPLVAGMIIGGIMTYLSMARHKFEARRLKKKLAQAEDFLAETESLSATARMVASAPVKSWWRKAS